MAGIILDSTTSKLQVVTSAAGKVDVHASWADLKTGPTVEPHRTLSSITTAATTDVVAAPSGTDVRTVNRLFVANNHASVANTVTIQDTNGTVTVPIRSATLAPGEDIAFQESVGFRVFDSAGREKITSFIGAQGAALVSDLVANAANTYLVGLPIGGRVQPGSFFKWRLRATKTAAGLATPIFTIVTGTAGTVADTVRVTHTGAAQTGVVDTGFFEIDAIVRAVGASATVIESTASLVQHSAAAGAGFGTITALSSNSAAFTLGAADYIGLAINPGSAGVWTFQHVLVDSGNLLS